MSASSICEALKAPVTGAHRHGLERSSTVRISSERSDPVVSIVRLRVGVAARSKVHSVSTRLTVVVGVPNKTVRGERSVELSAPEREHPLAPAYHVSPSQQRSVVSPSRFDGHAHTVKSATHSAGVTLPRCETIDCPATATATEPSAQSSYSIPDPSTRKTTRVAPRERRNVAYGTGSKASYVKSAGQTA